MVETPARIFFRFVGAEDKTFLIRRVPVHNKFQNISNLGLKHADRCVGHLLLGIETKLDEYAFVTEAECV